MSKVKIFHTVIFYHKEIPVPSKHMPKNEHRGQD